jgi:pyridoxamine 5'-phosphate oxidase
MPVGALAGGHGIPFRAIGCYWLRRMAARDPITRFQRWFAAASASHISQPEAMTLATADRRGRPSARMVLLKGVDSDGFVFYTNANSRKGRELLANPRAALVFHWGGGLGRQVRVEGRVEAVDPAEADGYWATRPRASQLGALASAQSHPIASRAALMARWRVLKRRYARAEVPRPPHWTGFRIVPDAIEFWTHRGHRLHDRELFTRTRRGWKRTVLQP